MHEIADTPTRQRKARLSLLGCSLAVFWSGCFAFGYPGVMGPYWQEAFNVGQTQTGMVMTCQLFALAIGMFFSGKVHMAIGMRRCIAIGTVINNLFGLKHFGVIYGLVFTAYGFVGSLLGPALSGVILDVTGGAYWIVFTYLATFSLVAALLMTTLARLTARR